MKWTKYAVLIGGVISILSFFLPYGAANVEGNHIGVSALDVLTGAKGTGAVGAKDAGGVALIWFPSMLLAALGGAGLARKKFQRLGGGGALVFGAWGTLLATALISQLGDMGKESGGLVEVSVGSYLLLVGSLLGAVGGLLALIKPDRG